jgi:hypothetical protein
MSKINIRVEKVSLRELKKILPEIALNGNANSKDGQSKKKNKPMTAKTKAKSKA